MNRKQMISIVELLITVLYLVLCVRQNGILPHSLSCTSYILPHYLDFTIYVITFIPFAFTLLKGVDHKSKVMVWLMIIGLLDVAISPHYRTENTFLHYFGGILCCVASVVYVANNAPKLLYFWIICFIICALDSPHRILYQELTCIVEMVALNLFVQV